MSAQLIAAAMALFFSAWAGLLSLGEESPSVARALADDPSGPNDPIPVYRALQVSRLSLLILAGTSAAVSLVWWDLPPVRAVITIVLGSMVVVFIGDILPRIVASVVSDLAVWAAPLARQSLLPFRPLLGLLASVERTLQTLFPAGAPDNSLDGAQREMLVGVFSLSTTTVDEIMTPRIDIMAVDYNSTWNELVEYVRKAGHTRLPVFRDNLDDVAGILFSKDIIPAIVGACDPPEHWQSLLRSPQFVPETKTVDQQLLEFRVNKGNLAIVVDEYGGTAGLLTLEDVIEEIVGEIYGEHDEHERPEIEREGDGKFWFDGGVSLDEVLAETGLKVQNEDVATVGGFIYSELGRVPNPGEELEIEGFRVVVEQVVRRRIKRVYFERRGVPTTAGGEE